jgi:hypothetical protein
MQAPTPRVVLQSLPAGERFAEQRHVVGMLEVRGAGDPGSAVRAAEIVRGSMGVEPDDADPPPGQRGGRERAHPSQSDDRDP